MTDQASSGGPAISGLIKSPALVTLAVTVLRLTGELEHWSTTYFDSQAGGGNAVAGITWLAPLFGIYFAHEAGTVWPRARVHRARPRVRGPGRGGAGGQWDGRFEAATVEFSPAPDLSLGDLCRGRAGHVTGPGESCSKSNCLTPTQLESRVAIIMFFAIRGHWGTHYDVAPSGMAFLNYFTKYL